MARLAKALNTEKSEEMKNKGKNKQQQQQQQTPQKSPGVKKVNCPPTKGKKNEEKIDVVESNAATEEKNKKKPEKKGTGAADVKTTDEKSKVKTNNEKKDNVKGKNDKEEQEDWADVIDFEMSDIVILDEYDSSKNPEVLCYVI